MGWDGVDCQLMVAVVQGRDCGDSCHRTTQALEERVAKNLGELNKQQARLEKLKVMQAASASRRAGGSGDG